MRKLFFFSFFIISVTSLNAQKDYKVVFDITSRDTIDHKNVIRWLNEIASVPGAQLEVVLYGKSLDMVTKDRSVVSNAVEQLSQRPNISFKACAVAMKNNNIDTSQLIKGVQIVPDGIYEIISRQREGWGYIKASR